ncbi:MAG: M48 family metallopeptidase [Syntrophales bacterium]
MEKFHFESIGRSVCILILSILVIVLISCATVPLTERKSLSLVSDQELNALSYQQYADIIKHSKLSTDPARIQIVKRVGERIATASGNFMTRTGRGAEIKDYRWEFNLIDDNKTVNAWCMPGGKIAVYSGILPITQNEDGLAVVIGHEVAHAIARHANERMSQALLVRMGGMGLSLALGQQPEATQQIFLSLYGIGSNVGFLLPYSRIQESEADHIGLILTAMAGYDPRAAVSLWQRMNQASGARTLEILSTHPAPASRIENIKAEIPEAMKYYKAP